MANEKDLNKEEITEEVEAVAKKEETKKAPNLTVTALRRENRKLNNQKEHTIVVGGEDYVIKVDQIFRKTKQHRLLEDLMLFLNEGNERVELLDLATPYITLLLIKHFTSLEIPDNIDGAIDVMDALTDLGIFAHITDLMPEDEVVGLYETVSASIDRMNTNIDELMSEVDEVAEKVENEEVIEAMLNTHVEE